MNQRLISLIGFLILGATLPAFAGPDWQVIEHARQAKHGPQTEGRVETVKLAAAGPRKCPPAALVLSPDHGPRAQSTPYLNKPRKERFDAEMTACRGGSK